MIGDYTIFILGAGASIPYNYPSGSKLKETVFSILGSSDTIRKMESMGFDKEYISAFRRGLKFSATSSVDSFLEHRPEFVDIGKITMAHVLMPIENENSLFTAGNDKWYPYLFDNLIADSFDTFGDNKVCFITFNYDRSLEQFLFTALKNRYGITDDDCASKLKNIPILHLHGKLNDLPWESNNGRPYDGKISSCDVVKRAASEIRIIHEDIEDDRLFKKAHSYIEGSDNIFFLGFGYHRPNLDRLNLNNFAEGGILQDKYIKGSSSGLKGAKRRFVNDYFKKDILAPSGFQNLGFSEEYYKF